MLAYTAEYEESIEWMNAYKIDDVILIQKFWKYIQWNWSSWKQE